MNSDLYLNGIGTCLGEQASTLEESVSAGRVPAAAAALRDAGFRLHHRAAPGTTALDLARRAAQPVAEGLGRVDALLYATTLPGNANLGSPKEFHSSGDVKHLADFPASRLQSELGLDDALVLGLTQQACTGLFGAIRTARGLLAAEPQLNRALCLTADRFPPGAHYLQGWSLVSDAAVATGLTRSPGPFRLLACHGRTNGALGRAGDDQIVGALFPNLLGVIRRTLELSGIGERGIDHLVLQNMDPRAGDILARALGRANAHMPTLAQAGHLIGGDPLLNLDHLHRQGAFQPGDIIALAAAGFGLHWQAMIVEYGQC